MVKNVNVFYIEKNTKQTPLSPAYTYFIGVFHPLDAVHIAEVGLTTGVIIAGIGRLLGISSRRDPY